MQMDVRRLFQIVASEAEGKSSAASLACGTHEMQDSTTCKLKSSADDKQEVQ